MPINPRISIVVKVAATTAAIVSVALEVGYNLGLINRVNTTDERIEVSCSNFNAKLSYSIALNIHK